MLKEFKEFALKGSVLDMAKARPVRHLMLNTSGVKIAESDAFASRLAEYMDQLPGWRLSETLVSRTRVIATRGPRPRCRATAVRRHGGSRRGRRCRPCAARSAGRRW